MESINAKHIDFEFYDRSSKIFWIDLTQVFFIVTIHLYINEKIFFLLPDMKCRSPVQLKSFFFLLRQSSIDKELSHLLTT